jgi:hypothetical protein
MSNQLLKPEQSDTGQNLAQILLMLIAAHPDTFKAKIDNVHANLGWRARDSTRSW